MRKIPVNTIIYIVLFALCVGPLASNSHAEEASYEAYHSTQQKSSAKAHTIHDPFESVNRAIFSFNELVDKYVFKPIAKTYIKILPKWSRERIHSFLQNLKEPVTFANALLQRDADRTFTAFWRFNINSTLGIGGLFDIAGIQGLEHRQEDFGQTLGTYGTSTGPFLMLPFMGPSNIRDAAGDIADGLIDPFNYLMTKETLWVIHPVSIVDKRANLLPITDEIERTSFDPYATLRSMYIQRRNNDIHNNKPTSKF